MRFAVLLVALAFTSADQWPHPRQGHETAVPASFDCAMRQAAYSYGQKLLPRKGNFKDLYFALDLNDPSCTVELTGNTTSLRPARFIFSFYN